MSTAIQLQDSEFALFQKMIFQTAGIHMSEAKKPLVSGRLARRLSHLGLKSYGDYFQLLQGEGEGELQLAIDLLTTNETFFFREQKHFDFLCEHVLPDWRTGPRRVWSAASSSGEEAYTVAMLLAEHAPTDNWEIVGTDISTRVLSTARVGRYPIQRAGNIPGRYLSKYCLRGVGSQEGHFIVAPQLRNRVQFVHGNLMHDLAKYGTFDVILLRNVLIYFNPETKRQVVSRVIRQLKPGGYLMVGHSESLNGIVSEVRSVVPSVYRKPNG